MRASERSRRASSALVVYVIILVAFQVFLITVAVEALQTDKETLAWSTAARCSGRRTYPSCISAAEKSAKF